MTTIGKASLQTVSSNGVATFTTISAGGAQFAGSGTHVNNATILASGSQTLGSTNTNEYAYASGTTISSGGVQLLADYGDQASATQIRAGGQQIIAGGGTAIGTTVAGEQSLMSYGGDAINTTIVAGGEQLIGPYGGANSTTIESGGLQVTSGAVENTVIAAGGSAVVLAGTLAGTDVQSGGTLYLLGGTATATTVEIGAYVVSTGVAFFSGTTVTLAPGSTVSGNIVAAANPEYVMAGGSSLDATILGSALLSVASGGTASADRVESGGLLALASGGLASGTVVEAGGLMQGLGGTAIDTTVSGTFYLNGGVASGTVVAALASVIADNGALDDTTIQDGGVVSAYGVVSGVTIDTGAVLSLFYGAPLSGADIRNGGTLVLGYNFGYPENASGVHLHLGGTLDFTQIAYYASSTIASLNPHDVLTVQDSLQDREQIGLTGNYAGDTFLLSNDGKGGTLVTLSVATSASFVSGVAPTAGGDVVTDDWRSLPAGAAGMHELPPGYATLSQTILPPAALGLDFRPTGQESAAMHPIVAWHQV